MKDSNLELKEYDDVFDVLPQQNASIHPLYFVDGIDVDALFFTLNRGGPEKLTNPDEPTAFELNNIEKNFFVNKSQKKVPHPYWVVAEQRNNAFGYTILHKFNGDEVRDEVIDDSNSLEDIMTDIDGASTFKKQAKLNLHRDVIIKAKESYKEAESQRSLLQNKLSQTRDPFSRASYMKQSNECYSHMKKLGNSLERIKILGLSEYKLKEYLYKLKEVYDAMPDSNINRKNELLAMGQFAKKIFIKKYEVCETPLTQEQYNSMCA